MPDGRLRWLDRVAGHRDATPRLTVDTARCNPLAISRIDEPEAIPREILPARPASAFAVNADEQQELYLALRHRNRIDHAPYEGAPNVMQRLARTSNGATCRSAASVESLFPFSLCINTTFRNEFISMVLQPTG